MPLRETEFLPKTRFLWQTNLRRAALESLNPCRCFNELFGVSLRFEVWVERMFKNSLRFLMESGIIITATVQWKYKRKFMK